MKSRQKRTKRERRIRRHRRVRGKVFGTSRIPRLCVFRSARHIYAQLIDDEKGQTIAAADDRELTVKSKTQNKKTKSVHQSADRDGKIRKAYEVGKLLARKAIAKKLTKVVFDRGGYQYHGRVRALAEGAREGGLEF